MNELLKLYVQNGRIIPPNQLRKLSNNLLKTYLRTFKGIFFWDIKNLFEIFYDLFDENVMNNFIKFMDSGGFLKFVYDEKKSDDIFYLKTYDYYNKIRIGMLKNILNILGFEKIKKGMSLYFSDNMDEPLSILIELTMFPNKSLNYIHENNFFQNFGKYFTEDMFIDILQNIDSYEYEEIWNRIPSELLEKHKDAVIRLSETTNISNLLPIKFVNKYIIK